MSFSFRELRKAAMRKLLPFLVAYPGQLLLRLITWTCDIEIIGLPSFLHVASKHKCILMLWHNRLALVPYTLSTYASHLSYAAFVSKSRDGELVASVAKSYPTANVIYVPHQSRHEALREMINRLEKKREVVLMTPDGPRGPCYKVKPGIAFAAQASSAYVVPWTWTADRCWELNTWDKFRIPKPFSKIQVSFGEPLQVSENDLEANTALLQEALSRLTFLTCP